MKKILALVLVCVLALSFVACGSAGNGANNGANNGAADGETIKIGGIGPTTGGAAVYGTAVKNAIQLAVDEINAAGGVNGIKLEFMWRDDEHNAEKSVNAFFGLMDDGMQVLVGTVTSAPCIAVVAEAEAENIFMLTPSGSAVDAIAAPNAFRVCFSDPSQGTAAANYISEQKLAEKVAVIYNVSDPYSAGIYEMFAAQAKETGINIVAAEAFTDDTATDFSVQIQKVKDSGADLLFLPIYYEAAALILQQADAAGLDIEYFGCDGLDGIIGQLGDNAALAEGVMLLTPFAADAPSAKTFVDAYKAKYGEIPNQFAADAYDAVYIIAKAMEGAGIDDPSIDHSDLCDALVEQITSSDFSYDGLTGENMTWNEDGEVSKTAKGMKIVNGAYVSMDK